MSINQNKHSKLTKRILICLALLLAVIIAYLTYVFIRYYRIEDNKPLDIFNPTVVSDSIDTNQEHSILSWNIGFGAYLQDYTFFMDGGKESRARSLDALNDNINAICDTLKSYNSDIILTQEVDFDSTRSFHIDERQIIEDKVQSYSTMFGQNYDSPYLFYPIFKPHGANKSGLFTMSKYDMHDGLRRSLPVQKGFAKIVDLDRCYDICRIRTSNDKYLVLINFHLSAYTTDPEISNKQLEKIYETIQKEYNRGNYVICGGDFNKDLLGDSSEIFGVKYIKKLSWCQPFPENDLPEHIKLVKPYDSGSKIPSCRSNYEPYQKGHTFVCTVDGFLVSDNVNVRSSSVYDTEFKFSDHNPVLMLFTLE